MKNHWVYCWQVVEPIDAAIYVLAASSPRPFYWPTVNDRLRWPMVDAMKTAVNAGRVDL